jgi:hypothetical protein
MSNQMPVTCGGRYWFNPSFLFVGGSLAYLDFHQVDDISKALAAVGDDATSEGPGYVFYPDYKVRFRTSLDEYPRELTEAELKNLAGYEARMYAKSGILKHCNELTVGDYKYLIVWQGNFKAYLEDEYTLGSELWILGAIVTYDVWEKVGYIFVRDFMLGTVEDLLERKLAALKGLEG